METPFELPVLGENATDEDYKKSIAEMTREIDRLIAEMRAGRARSLQVHDEIEANFARFDEIMKELRESRC